MKLKHTFLSAIFASSMFLSQPVIADPFELEQAVAYAKAGNYTPAFKTFKTFAEQGNATAQFSLGLMYERGHGTTRNDKQALYWYQKAAEQGFSPAQYNLGIMYKTGQGATKNDKQAFYWYQKAAEQGHKMAQTSLGYMYYTGQGTAKNKQKALYWYQKACLAREQNACDYLKHF